MQTIPTYKCGECGAIHPEPEWLHAPNPFDARGTLLGCPACKAADSHRLVCDAPGCTELATCGWPSPHGYRRTCGEHRQEAERHLENLSVVVPPDLKVASDAKQGPSKRALGGGHE